MGIVLIFDSQQPKWAPFQYGFFFFFSEFGEEGCLVKSLVNENRDPKFEGHYVL